MVKSYLRGLLPTLVTLISLTVLVSRFLLQFLNLARDNIAPSAEHKSKLQYFPIILAVVGLVTMNVTAFALEAYGSRQNLWTLAELVTWLYVLVLAILQVVLPASYRRTLELWNHLTAIYAVQWAFKLILIWSAIVHPQLIQPQTLTIAECFLTSLLFFIAVTTQNNNTKVSLLQEEDLEPSREPSASLLSKSTFSWVYPLLRKGYRKVLQIEDVWDLVLKDKARAILADYRQEKTTAKLLWRLLNFFRFSLLKQCAYSASSTLIGFAPVLLMKSILEYMENPDGKPRNAEWFFVFLLLSANIAESFLSHQIYWISDKVDIRMSAIIKGEIFSKVLRRKTSVAGDTGRGDENRDAKARNENADQMETLPKKVKNDSSTDANVMNLVNGDTPIIADIPKNLHQVIPSTPIRLIGCLIILWRILGLSSIPCLVVICLLLPVNIISSIYFSRTQRRTKAASDKRIQITNESLLNIRIVKFFAWEGHFAKMVNEKRSAEMKALSAWYRLWALVGVVDKTAPVLMVFGSFLVYTLFERKPLYPSVAFAVISLVSRLKEPLSDLVDAIMGLGDATVSINRVDAFLKGPETEKSKKLSQNKLNGDRNIMIGFIDASFTWDGESAFRLVNLNIKFAVGKLNVISGQTGSGKTSLLMALLGEMTKTKGTVYLPGDNKREEMEADSETGLTETVAFGAQKPWLMNNNVKNNILFGSPIDEKRYRDVIVACGLERDLDILGDETMVGEKGVTLSGGQKQRISIARAIYSSSRTVILDDCLSSVDSDTAKWIFDNCITGPLMRNRTCILVTHNIKLCVPFSQYVVVLENGEIAVQGTSEFVLASGRLHLDENKTQSDMALGVTPATASSDAKVSGKTVTPKAQRKNGSSAKDEFQAAGAVKFDVAALYLKSMGPWRFWLLGIILFAARPLPSLASNFWIRQWVNQYSTRHTTALLHDGTNDVLAGSLLSNTVISYGKNPSNSAINIQANDAKYKLTIYALISLVGVLVSLSHRLWTIHGGLMAGTRIHQRTLHSVYHATFKFLDTTPIGQLMNRFSGDMARIPSVAFHGVVIKSCALEIIITIILISAVVPGFLVAAIPISAMYFMVAKFYIRSSRELKRIESVQNSPLCQHFSETLAGIKTIRAYGDELRFERDNSRLIDAHHRPFIYRQAMYRWLSLYLDLLGTLVVFCTAVLIIFSLGTINAGSAGLILVYAMNFTEYLHWAVQYYGKYELEMNCTERLKEYVEIEPEKEFVGKKINPPPNWPNQGSVEFVNYTARYRTDLEPALQGISFKINPGEKIGIVGRTGSGKTSLALGLLRFLEAEKGKILIDDIEIGCVPLPNLRASITVVPQDATLFNGTIRSNLDPFNLYTDEDIFTVLRQVQLIRGHTTTTIDTPEPSLADAVSISDASINSSTLGSNANVFLNLSSLVTESGDNFSRGECQLLCLARALLKHSKVLVMDEATASIDYDTDVRIQETIRNLKDTIITIAHRLQTIIDYDNVLVLDQGKVSEFGHPHELLRKGGGFKRFCEMSGDFEALKKTAKAAYEARRLVDDE